MNPKKQQQVKLLTTCVKNKSINEVFDLFLKYLPILDHELPWEKNINNLSNDKELLELLKIVSQRRQNKNFNSVYGLNFHHACSFSELGYGEGEFVVTDNNKEIDLYNQNAFVLAYHNEDFIIKIDNSSSVYLVDHEMGDGFKVGDNIQEALHFFLGLELAEELEITSEEYVLVYEEEHGDSLKPRIVELFINWL